MKIIVIGCGRMGAALARTLILREHSVTVIDRDPDAFARLGPAFKGRMVTGVGFDRDVLVEAGIQKCDGLAAVTASDEANAVAGRVASQMFRVPRVVARLYDPGKAEIYRRLGLQTISPVTWGVNRIADLLCYSQFDAVSTLGAGQVDMVDVEAPQLLIGKTVKDITVINEVQVVAVTRGGKTFIPTLGTVFQYGDLLHLAVVATSIDRVKSLLGL